MIKIENAFMRVEIDLKGAELTSVYDINRNRELLWQADPAYWSKHAPILFPIVGSLKEGHYQYGGKSYALSRHGFARDQVFTLEAHTDHHAVFSLTYTQSTLKFYPFHFKLLVTYTIKAAVLEVKYEVVNLGDNEMLFSIGAHPAFNCDLASEQYSLKLNRTNKSRQIEHLMVSLQTGLIMNKRKLITLEAETLKLSPDLFNEDALIFEGKNISGFDLISAEGETLLKFKCKDYPYIGIWSPRAPFVCIEPWHGIADFEDSNQLLRDKKEIIVLQGQEAFNCHYSIGLK